MVTATGARRNLTTRPLAAADLRMSHGLSQAVKWPHRLEDWEFVHRLGSGLAVDDAGILVGTGMYWLFGPDFASLGLVIVAPDRQGGGIGRQLMAGLLAGIGDRATLLNATEAGMPLYEKLGFRAIGRIQQHQGDAFAVPSESGLAGDRIRPLAPEDHAAVAALDEQATGLPRARVLAALGEVAEAAVLERDGRSAGFAFCRRFVRGHVVGPVVAPDAAGARMLIAHWMAACRGSFLRIDAVEAAGLSGWLAGLGLTPVAPAVTMVRGKAPQPAASPRLFSIINQALG
jgi:GNAT superfamily N-acetyltransferase